MEIKFSIQEGSHLPSPVPPVVDSSEDPLLPLEAMARLNTAAGSAARPAHTWHIHQPRLWAHYWEAESYTYMFWQHITEQM